VFQKKDPSELGEIINKTYIVTIFPTELGAAPHTSKK
jgi:hypothetical protein